MKKTFSRSLSWMLSVVMIFGVFIVPTSIQVSATQSKKENFSRNYTTVSGNPGQTVANIAYAQVGKSGSALGYTEDWCADFVSDCADLAGQSAAVPRHGRADYIDEYIYSMQAATKYQHQMQNPVTLPFMTLTAIIRLTMWKLFTQFQEVL